MEQRKSVTRRYVVERLYEIRRAETIAEMLNSELQDVRGKVSTIRGVSYDGDRVQSSDHKTSADVICEVVDRERELLEMIAYATKRRAGMIEELKKLQDSRHIAVLYDRFVEGLSLRETARKRHYSIDRIKQLQSGAIQAYARAHGWEIVPDAAA